MMVARARMRFKPAKVGVWLLALLLALISLLPVLWIVATSFKTFVSTQAVPPTLPDLTNWSAYEDVFVTGDVQAGSATGPLINSLIIATGATIVTMLVAIPAAFALARYLIARKPDIQFWIISTRMMPLIAAIVPLSIMYSWVGLADSYQGMIIIYLMMNLSFAVWLLTSFFIAVPREIEEAARIDGVSRFGVLRHVSVPLARAGIVVVAIFTWVFSWNELLAGLVLTTGRTATLPVYLSTFATNTMTFFQHMAAVVTIQIIPAVIIVFLLQRYIISGMSLGAVSGE